MNGKRKCKMLKEIRKQIARENDITYITTECKHQGNCKGTCPKCESEVRYLEAELEKRRKAGKTVAVAGIAAAMMLNAVKALAGIPAQIPLIAPNVIQSIAHMKHDILKGGYTSLNLDEALIGLAISCTTNPTAQIATEKLNELRGCEVHMTHIVTPGDEAGLRRLGCRFTSDPYFASNALFTAGQ